MILVAVGASPIPFDRLLRAVAALPRHEQMIVQHGPSAIRPPGAHCVSFLPLDRLAELVREARVVVTHAGVGSILLALGNGKRPYVVPRLQAFGETVDDHQLDCARRFARSGVVTLVEDPAALQAAIASNGSSDRASIVPASATDLPLVQELRTYVTELVEATRSRDVA